MLSEEEIKSLEERYGKNNFCYQCGNPDLKPIKGYEKFEFCKCPKCGASDLNC